MAIFCFTFILFCFVCLIKWGTDDNRNGSESVFVTVMNCWFSLQFQQRMLHLQNKFTYAPKTKPGFSSWCESQNIVCSRWKHNKLHQTIIKGHGTQSSFVLCFSAAKGAISSSFSPLFSFSSPLSFNRIPLVLITTSSSNGKSIQNRYWGRGPLLSLCAALTSLHRHVC